MKFSRFFDGPTTLAAGWILTKTCILPTAFGSDDSYPSSAVPNTKPLLSARTPKPCWVEDVIKSPSVIFPFKLLTRTVTTPEFINSRAFSNSGSSTAAAGLSLTTPYIDGSNSWLQRLFPPEELQIIYPSTAPSSETGTSIAIPDEVTWDNAVRCSNKLRNSKEKMKEPPRVNNLRP